MELIFIGDDFYQKSGTMMSPIYSVTGERCDWGFVNCALRRGESVHIRPATSSELDFYNKKLQKWLAETK